MDRKTGDWIFYYPDGITPKLKGTFENGRPNGPYIKFWDNGNTKEEGKFTEESHAECEESCIGQHRIIKDWGGGHKLGEQEGDFIRVLNL